MKRFLTPAATFNPTAGTLDLSAIPNFDIRRLAAVFDLKTQVMIYGPVAGFGTTAVTNGVLTLQASLAGLGAADQLLVIYDDATGKVAEDASVQSVLVAINTLITDLANNHADLQGLHTDLSATIHADLAAIAAKLGSSPAQSGDVQAVVSKLGTPAQTIDIQAIATKLGSPAQSGDVAAVVSRLGAQPAQTTDITVLANLLQSLLTTLQAQRTETLWTDDTGTYFVRVEIPGNSAPTWLTYTGAASAAPGAGARPAAGASILTTTDTFRAQNTASGASPAYNAGNILKHIETIDPKTGVIVGQFWVNVDQNTSPAASAVLTTDLVLLDGQSEGAATLAAQTTGNGLLSNMLTALATLHTDSQTQHTDLVAVHTDAGSTLHADLVALSTALGAKGDAATATTLMGLTAALLARTPALGVALAAASSPFALATDQLSVLAKDATVTALGALIGTLSAPAAGTVLALLAALKSDLDTGLTNDTQALSFVTATQTWQGNLLAAIGKILSNAPRVVASGTLSAVGDAVAVACDGMNTAVIQLTAAAAGVTGAGVFEASADNQATWTAVNMVPYAGGAAAAGASAATATQLFEMACGGLTHVRFRCTTAFSAANAAIAAATNGHKSLRVGAPAGNPLPVLTQAAGLGALLQAPAGSTNGTALTTAGAMPTGAKGALLLIPPGGEIDIAIAAAQPSAAPFSMPYPNTSPFTLEIFVELNGMLGFITKNVAGTVNGSSAPCGLRWI